MNISSGRMLWRKIWCIAKSPLFAVPAFIGGMSLATTYSWYGTRFFPESWFLLGGIGCLAFATSWAVKSWLSSDGLTERALKDIQKKARVAHTRRLRELRRMLRVDRDRRTSDMVKRLQRIYDRLLAAERWALREDAEPVFNDVREYATELYQSCLGLLERSLDLWKVSREVSTESARTELYESRESIVKEVDEGIANLERTLDHMQTTQLKGGTRLTEDAVKLRTELEEGLEVARKVEHRMKQLEAEIGIHRTLD